MAGEPHRTRSIRTATGIEILSRRKSPNRRLSSEKKQHPSRSEEEAEEASIPLANPFANQSPVAKRLVSRGWIDRGWARIDDRRDEACRFKSACERASEERSSRPDPEIDPTSSFYRSITSIPRHNRSWSGTCTSRTRRWLLISTWVPW